MPLYHIWPGCIVVASYLSGVAILSTKLIIWVVPTQHKITFKDFKTVHERTLFAFEKHFYYDGVRGRKNKIKINIGPIKIMYTHVVVSSRWRNSNDGSRTSRIQNSPFRENPWTWERKNLNLKTEFCLAEKNRLLINISSLQASIIIIPSSLFSSFLCFISFHLKSHPSLYSFVRSFDLDRPKRQIREYSLAYFVRGSITVQLTSCLTG